MSNGRLSEAELEAIRDLRDHWRDEIRGNIWVRSVDSLLAALDAALADLAAAEGEVDGLRLLVTDLVHPEGDGREAQARCYREGRAHAEEWCVVSLRERAGRLRASAEAKGNSFEADAEMDAADVLDDAALALESPPAPAAVPEGE